MATCKDCINYEACIERGDVATKELCEGAEKDCKLFKNKADFEKVKHGEWQRQKNGFYFLCSICRKASATKGNYCHNCGAKMD